MRLRSFGERRVSNAFSSERVVADDRGLFLVATASGPAYGGVKPPKNLDRAVAAFTGVWPPSSTESPAATLERALELLPEPQSISADYSDGHPAWTATILGVKGTSAAALHVGVNRLYRFRDAELKRLSEDHSVRSTVERDSPETFSAVEAQCFGIAEFPPSPQRVEFEIRIGDQFVLCSPGVWRNVPEHRLLAVLANRVIDVEAQLHAILDASATNEASVVLMSVESDDID